MRRPWRLLPQLRLPVSLWSGPARGLRVSARALVVGHEPDVEFLPRRFFDGPVTRERLGSCFAWNVAREFDRWRSSVDLAVARVDRLLERGARPRACLVVPDWVGARVAVPDDLDRFLRTTRGVRSDVLNIEAHRVTTTVSHDGRAFEAYYDTMYVPTASARHGDLAVIRDRAELGRQFRSGGLIQAWLDGHPAGAAVFASRPGGSLAFLAIGLRQADLKLTKQGVPAALYLRVLREAHQRGCRYVDLGASRPWLRDGVLQYKRKWGAEFFHAPDLAFLLLVHFGARTDVRRAFFEHTPLIVRDGRGLTGVHADGEDGARRLFVPGLQRMMQERDWHAHHPIGPEAGGT